MELVLKDSQNTLTVADDTFDCNFNEALIHQVIIAYSACSRQGTHAQKTHADVTGSSKKPWRQKGTGRARSGSVKSPIWRSGGVTFAARSQDYSQKINKKMYRGALKVILSELVRQDRLIVIEKLLIEAPKTKLLNQKIKDMDLSKDVLIIINDFDYNLFLAARNLYKVDVRNATRIDPVSLISFDKIVITAGAIKQIEEMLV